MRLKIGKWVIDGNDNAITLLIVSSLSYYPVTYALNEIVNWYIQYGAWWDSALCAGVFLCVVMFSLPVILKRQSFYSVLFFLGAVLIFLFTILTNMDGSYFAQKEAVLFFTTYLPFLFVGLAIRNFEQLDYAIGIGTKVVIMAAIIWIAIVIFHVNKGLRVAYMNVSYSVLPSCLFRIYYYFRDRGIKNLLWMIAGILCHIIWGTRGPILFLFIFVAMCIIWSHKSRKAVILAILIAAFSSIIYYNFFEILKWANEIFIRMGLQNGGIIKLLTEEDLLDGRGNLVSQIMPYVNKHLIFGGGIYCDRPILGGYVHLFPLELVCNFGIVIGSLLSCGLVYQIVRRSIRVRVFGDFRWALLWTVIIVGFAKLFVSGSYLEEPYFYFLLGLLANKEMKQIK